MRRARIRLPASVRELAGARAPKLQRPLSAEERGTAPTYPCSRSNSGSEAYCEVCALRPPAPGQCACSTCAELEASRFSGQLACFGAGQRPPPGYEVKDVSRGTEFGNPIGMRTYQRSEYVRAVRGFEDICANLPSTAGGPLPAPLLERLDCVMGPQLELTRRRLKDGLWSVSREGDKWLFCPEWVLFLPKRIHIHSLAFLSILHMHMHSQSRVSIQQDSSSFKTLRLIQHHSPNIQCLCTFTP